MPDLLRTQIYALFKSGINISEIRCCKLYITERDSCTISCFYGILSLIHDRLLLLIVDKILEAVCMIYK